MATSTYSFVATGQRIPVNQTTAGHQYAPAVAVMADGSFVAAYNDGAELIRMRRFSSAGSALGDEIVVSGGTAGDLTPRLARLSDGRLVVGWSDDVGVADNAAIRIYSPSLQPLTAAIRVNPTGTAASLGNVAATGDGGYVVAYEVQKSATDHDLYTQRYDAAGVAVGAPVALDTSAAYAAQSTVAALPDGGYAVAYSVLAEPGRIAGSSLMHAIVNADSSFRLAPTVTDAADSATGVNALPVLTPLPSGKLLLSYVDNYRITTLTLNEDGNTVGSGPNVQGGMFGMTDPDLAVSATGYTLVSYTQISHGVDSTGLALYGPGGSPFVGGSSVWTSYNPAGATAAWLDDSRAVSVYSVNTDVADGGDGDGWGIIARIHQVERNTIGAAASETIWLDGLADRVTMGGGDDGVFAGDGNNTVSLGAGNDVAVGGSGPDALLGGAGVDWLYGMGGADYLYGGDDTDALTGGDGNDFLFGEEGDDYAFGDAGDDAISGGAGVDRLYGGTGNDTVDGGGETDALYGEDGNDLLFGGTGDDYLFGGADADILLGGSGNDLLSGDVGNDTLVGETGSDWLIGGAGSDVFQVQGLDSGVDTIVDFQPGLDSVLLIGTARTGSADAAASLVQVGANTVLMTSSTSGLIFLNTQVSQFTGASFAVV